MAKASTGRWWSAESRQLSYSRVRVGGPLGGSHDGLAARAFELPPSRPDSSPETSAFRALRAVRISPGAAQLLMSSCISASGTVNQRLFGARGLSMRGETIRQHAREGRPGTRPRHSAGAPRETSARATSCRKTAYARRKTRTPRPGGQGVHSEPAGAPVSRAPLEVVMAGRVSNNRWVPGCREGWMTPRGALDSGFQLA